MRVPMLTMVAAAACVTGAPARHAAQSAPSIVTTIDIPSAGITVAPYETTNGVWEAVMGDTPLGRYRIRPSTLDKDWPVLGPSLTQMAEFCNVLSVRSGYAEAYAISAGEVAWNRSTNGFRLPTETEWEYAARAGEAFEYAGGDDVDRIGLVEAARVQRIRDRHSGLEMHPNPVGSLAANRFGMFDMSGNAPEMVWDRFAEHSGELPLTYNREDADDSRVCKGGGYPYDEEQAKISARRSCMSDGRFPIGSGFRVVRSIAVR